MPRRLIKKLKEVKDESQKFLFEKTLERKLRKKQRQIEKQLSRFARKTKRVKGDYRSRFPIFGRGKDEDAQEVERYNYRLSLEHGLELELEKVTKALQKIKEGKYGICENCGGKINPERLKIYPEARYCMKCHKKGEE